MARKKGKKGGQKQPDDKKEEDKTKPREGQTDTKKESEQKTEKQETKSPQQVTEMQQPAKAAGGFSDVSESAWKTQTSKRRTEQEGISQSVSSSQAATSVPELLPPAQPGLPAWMQKRDEAPPQPGLPAWMQKRDEAPRSGRGRGRGRGVGRGRGESVVGPSQDTSASPGAAQIASSSSVSPGISPWNKQAQPITRSPPLLQSPQPPSSARSSPPLQSGQPLPSSRPPPPLQSPQPVLSSSSPWNRQASATEQKAPGSPLESTGAVPKGVQQKNGGPVRGPRKSPPGSTDQLAEKMGQLQLSVPGRKANNTGGKKGRHTFVETNHLRLNLSGLSNGKHSTIYQYDVTVEPDTPRRLLRYAVRELCLRHMPNVYPAYDGRKIMYCSTEVDDVTDTVEVCEIDSDRPKQFTVTIKYVTPINVTSLFDYMRGDNRAIPYNAVQAVDVILRQAPAFRFVPVGRSYFSAPTGRIIELGDGSEMWYGFYQSAILGWKPFLNIDVAHKAFPKKQPVLDLIYEFSTSPRDRLRGERAEVYLSRIRNVPSGVIERLNKFLKGLKIGYSLPNNPGRKRVYRVNAIMPGDATRLQFRDNNGRSYTIESYFKTEKGISLDFPHLPCLHVGSLQRENPIYLPVEFCEVESGQSTNRKMTEQQTTNMIKYAATNAPDRKKKIMDAITHLKFNTDRSVKEFGLSVVEKFEKVKARILNPPLLKYKNSDQHPYKGVWKCDKFFSAKNLDRWVIVNLDEKLREDQLRHFTTLLQSTGNSLNMQIKIQEASKTIPIHQDRNLSKFENYIAAQKKNGITFFLVVIPDRVPGIYATVKQVSELRVGALTQCIKSITMQKRINQSTVQNILLKINSKMDGINHTFSDSCKPKCLEKPVMFVGADVTHPSPDQRDIPSVVAVCASYDATALYKYNMECRLQPPRTEMIQDLEQIMVSQLNFFYNATNHKPEKIFYFRDGISEGEFQVALNVEMMAIRRACQRVNPNYNPKITFLVVQKRHHTRFFPLDPNDEDGKNKNVPPGTVVDTDITHPTELDFYLVSHASIQGVSRPTKYRRLWDDNDMNEDELEELTYYLCHMFSRCTRAVSYPTPTYYAHLAAYRARIYIEGKRINLDDLVRAQKEHAAILDDVKNKYPMFFV